MEKSHCYVRAVGHDCYCSVMSRDQYELFAVSKQAVIFVDYGTVVRDRDNSIACMRSTLHRCR